MSASALSLLERRVIIRSNQSGVWFGTLEAYDGETTVILTDARRCWSWTGAGSCSGLAVRGPSGGRIAEPVTIARIGDVCEVLAATDAATRRFGDVQPWLE